jgi:hypothetical protein
MTAPAAVITAVLFVRNRPGFLVDADIAKGTSLNGEPVTDKSVVLQRHLGFLIGSGDD